MPAPPHVSNPVPIVKPIGHVLVIEADANAGKLLQAILTDLLIETLVFPTGEAALHHMATQAIDLVLLETTLPGISGLEVCRRVKADPHLRHIPLIFVSTQHQHQLRARAFVLGAAEYLAKPFDRRNLIACVTRHLTLSRASLSGQPPGPPTSPS